MSCFCHHSHQSACSKKADGWLNTWSALDCHSNVCVWEKNPLKLMSMLAKWPLCFFYISHCASEVKVMILNFISCGSILEVQDNLRCRNSSFSHLIMFWLKTFYIHFSQFVWCSCTQFKINACLKRYRLLLCDSRYTIRAMHKYDKINPCKCTPKYLYLHFKDSLCIEKKWKLVTIKDIYSTGFPFTNRAEALCDTSNSLRMKTI